MNNEIKLAPVILFCYNRPDLTMRTLDALQQNQLAKYTELHIYIDGPKTELDEEKVNETVRIARTFKGFRNIHLIESETNKGLANSVINGVTDIITKYDKAIILEDDLITHPSFLKYMNEALNFYENQTNIWSISGYTPNIKFPDNYKDDLFLTLRGSSWGWATWRNRWDKVKWEWTKKDFKEFTSKKHSLDLIGEDIYHLTKDYKKGFIDSWAIRWTNTQFILGKFTVFPRYTFIQNEGFGGDSTHGSLNNKFKTTLLDSDLEIKLSEVRYNKEIEKVYSNLYKLKFYNKIAILLKKVKVYKLTKKIVKKIR